MKKIFLRLFLLVTFVLMYSFNAIAGSSGKTGTIVSVTNDFEWHGSTSVSRSGSYSYVTLWCNYVIPNITGVSDSYSEVQVTAKTSGGTHIGCNKPSSTTSSFITLKENSSSDTNLYLIEGHIGDSKIYLCYRNIYTYVPIKANVFYKGN